MAYRDKRNSIFGDKEDFGGDINDAIHGMAEQWISNFQEETVGTVFPWTIERSNEFKNIPIETLVRDPYFLGFKDKVYDGVLEDIIALWEEKKRRPIHLALFLEGIGSGKTVKSSILMWLSWYDLSVNYVDPQEFFNLAPRSVIAFMMMSRSEIQARKVTFTEVWNRFQSPFNKDYFPPHERFSREIRIDVNNTCVFAGTSSSLSALGYNLFGGVIDEAAFLEVVEDSKRSDTKYDAAEEMYNAVYHRMVSRFAKEGKLPGLLCMVSSPRFPDDFIHRKIDEAISNPQHSGIFWRRRSTWEAKGKKFFPNEDFFYIDTETSEIIMDKETIRFLDTLQPNQFPLNYEVENINKISKYLK